MESDDDNSGEINRKRKALLDGVFMDKLNKMKEKVDLYITDRELPMLPKFNDIKPVSAVVIADPVDDTKLANLRKTGVSPL